MADATFVTNVDLSNNELRNAKAQMLASDPTGVEGKFIYNSTDKQLKFYNGTAWVSGGAAVADLSSQAAAFAQTARNGTATTAARSDHYHALPAHDAAAHSAIKLSDLAAPNANIAMGGNKLTGLGAGSANGDSLRYEQVVGVYLPLSGGTLSGVLTVDPTANATDYPVIVKNNTAKDSRLFVQRPVGAASAGITLGDSAGKSEALMHVNNNGMGIALRLNGSTDTSQISFYSGDTLGASVGTTDIGIRAKKVQFQATTVELPADTSIGTITATELGYIDGLTSSAQTQITAAQTTANNALPKAGGTMSGAIAMGSNKITGLANGTASGDAMHYGQIVGTYAPLANPGFSGTVAAPTFAVSGVNGASSMFLLGPDTQSSVNVIRVPPQNNDHAGFELKVGNDIASPVLSLRAISHSNGTVGTLSFVDSGSGQIHMNKPLVMNSNKITGVTAGAATGEVVTYDQLAGYQPLDGDLTAIAALSSNGYARRTGTNAWTIDASIPQASVTNLTNDLNLKAPLASPALTGTPTAPTAPNGTVSTQLATLEFVANAVSAAAAGLEVKGSVVARTTVNVDLANSANLNSTNCDGVTLATGDRVLVMNQTAPAENGIYTKSAGTTAAIRAYDFNSSEEASPGTFVFVEKGTLYADTGWVLTTDAPITLGTTGLTFTQFSGPGTWTWGTGLTSSGNTVNVGAGTGISVAADTVGIDTSVVPRKYSVTLSGTAASQTVTHNLGTQDVVVSVRRVADNVVVYTGVTAATTNTVTIDFASTVTANAYRVTVMA